MNDTNLGKTPILRLFFSFAVPSVIAVTTQMMAGLIDSFFVGNYIGSQGLSAIALFTPVITIVMGIGMMLAIGGTTLAGIQLGHKDRTEANNTFNIALLLLICTAVVSSVGVYFFRTSIAEVLGAVDKIKDYTIEYSGTLSQFFIFYLANAGLIYFLKLDEKPKLIMIATMIGVAINIVLDFLFIKEIGLGLYGAALATGISQMITFLVMFIALLKRSSFRLKFPKIKMRTIGEIVFNGSSELVSMMAISISALVFNFIIINQLGVAALSAYAVVIQIFSLATGLSYGIAEAPQAAISFNLGAGSFKRVQGLRKISAITNLMLGIGVAVTTYFAGTSLAAIFISEKEIISLAGEILKPISFGILMMGVNITIGSYYTAVNDPILSGSVTLLRSLIGILAGVILLPKFFGVTSVWWSIMFAELITLGVCIYLVKWKPFGLNQLKEI